jgi:hypothetical protein
MYSAGSAPPGTTITCAEKVASGVPIHSRSPPLHGRRAGGVGVEGEHDLAGEPAQQLEVLGPQGGAAGGHGLADPGLVAGDHVGVALDHDREPGH